MDDIVSNDEKEMKLTFEKLVEDNSNLKILFSASRYVDGYFVKNLKGLDPV
jgi:hypothetical protein